MNTNDPIKQALIRNCIYAEKDFGFESDEYYKANSAWLEYENQKYKEWERQAKHNILKYLTEHEEELSINDLYAIKLNFDNRITIKQLKERIKKLEEK